MKNLIMIHYKFADGHMEEIEVTEEVAAEFERLEKYEKKVERKGIKQHVLLNVFLEAVVLQDSRFLHII